MVSPTRWEPGKSFLSTLSLRRATGAVAGGIASFFDFYPRSPCGERPTAPAAAPTPANFYPRSPCGERRSGRLNLNGIQTFLSTLSLRRATTMAGAGMTTSRFLSTLSLRRATVYLARVPAAADYFYPRSPCGERHLGAGKPCNVCHFYPRSPCGERRINRVKRLLPSWISIHALLAESDVRQCRYRVPDFRFLSTLSLRRATRRHKKHLISQTISIHALLAESDCFQFVFESRKHYFYPRSPCGERPQCRL